MLKDFVKKIVFRLIQENIKFLSKGKGLPISISLTMKNNFFSKRQNFNQENIEDLLIGRGLAMKTYKFFQFIKV